MLSVASFVASYSEVYPDELEHLSRINSLVAAFDGTVDLISRSNFAGHITASGFVLSPDRSAVLLVAHRALGIFVQPGGHLDGSDTSPLAGARREVLEETGLGSLMLLPVGTDPNVPFDIDSHYIPPNAKKGEPEHWHHDFRYLFVCEDVNVLQLATVEVEDARWVLREELGGYPTFDRVGRKMAELPLSCLGISS